MFFFKICINYENIYYEKAEYLLQNRFSNMDNSRHKCYNKKEVFFRVIKMFNIEEELKKLPSKPRSIYNERQK